MQDGHDKLFELLEEFKTAMLVTRTQTGGVHARPMRVAKFNKDGVLYFVTSRDSPKIKEISDDPEVTVIFQDGAKYVTLAGSAEVAEDRQLVESMWSEAWKVWFPKGKVDPMICIVMVRASQAEYWDNEGMEGLSYAFAAAEAYVTGEKPAVDSDVHGKVTV
jgi:general stress protein 26